MKKYILKSKTIILAIVLSIGVFHANAQTGPGGVGNSDGSNGQPENTLWLETTSLLFSDGAAVDTWTDISGNNNDASQVLGSKQPSFVTAGSYNISKPVISFDNGNQDFLDFSGNTVVGSDYTIFLIAAKRSGGNKWVMGGTLNSAASNKNLHFGWQSDTEYRYHQWGWQNDYTNIPLSVAPSSGTGIGSFGIMTLLNDASYIEKYVYQNNTELVLDATQASSGYLISWDGAGIGGAPQINSYSDIDVAEVVFYRNGLNEAQRTIVSNYLSEKYSIAISNDHITTVAPYNNSICGIGEEADGEHLEASSNGFYLTGLSDLNVGDYIFAANNNAANSSADFSTADLPAGTVERYNRIWYVEKTNTPAAEIAFDFSEAVEDGLNPTNISNYVLLYRSGTVGDFSVVKNADGVKNGDQVYFNLTVADLQDGYYTFGTEDDLNSPLKGIPGRTWYTLISGNWGDWEIWTLDPSGAQPNNPDHLTPNTSPTNTADKVVIKTGRTVEVDTINNLNHVSITIEGRLDLTTTTNHSFGEIRGTGRVLLAADNFPSGDASHFYSEGQGEGTVEYYGGSYDLSTAREFFDVEVILDDPANTITLLKDYDINGNLTITTGKIQINDDTDDQLINLTVDGDVLVETNGGIFTGSGNPFATANYQIGTALMPINDGLDYHDVYHQFIMNGNFTNRGIVRLTNINAPDYNSLATNGGVTVRFQGASNSDVNLYNTTDFYNLVIDKGTDKTYKVNLYSDNVSYFTLFGANNVGRTNGGSRTYNNEDPQIRKALFVYRGTLQLRGNVYIPSLTEGFSTAPSGGNGDYAIGKNARLWMDGSNVTVYSTASDLSQITGYAATADGVQTNSTNQAMSLYGEFRITNGYFGTRNSGGFIFWAAAAAQVKIEGGTVNVSQMRDGGSSGIASYTQTGGQLVVRGNSTEVSEVSGSYPLFGLASEDGVFNMSGGEILIQDISGAADGDFYIPCAEGNYKVTGGTVTFELADEDTAHILSTANFWNLEIDNADGSGGMVVELDTTLKVSNDLTLNPYCTLEVNDPNTGIDHDVYIGRNFSILEDGTTKNIGIYNFQNNTTVFDGTEDGEFYIGWNHNDDYEQDLWNLTVNKTEGKRITIMGDPNKDPGVVTSEYFNRLLQVENDANVISGILDQGRQSIRLFEGVSLKKKGQLGVYDVGVTPITAYIMFRDGDLTIYSDPDAVFGNIKFNSTGTVTFTSDVYIKRIGYYQGMYNIGTYNLKVDYLHRNGTSTKFNIGNGNVSKMIYSSGNSSDGGLSLLVSENETYSFPFGVAGKYTPAEVILTNFSDIGYLTINPVNGELKTADAGAGDILSYYWRVGYDGFTTKPTVKYNFIYDDSDVSGDETKYVPAYVLDQNPYTRHVDGSKTDINNTTNTINFDWGGVGNTLEKANYTAGDKNRFTGSLDIYYSESTGSYDWSGAGSSWHRGSPTGPDHEPVDGSIVKIMGNARINVYSTSIADLALLEFEGTNTSPTSENVGRVQFHVDGNYDLGSVRDTGMISFEANRTINISADFGDFGSVKESFFMYFGGGDNTITGIPTPIPNLMLESGVKRIGESIFVGNDFILNGWSTIYLENDLEIERDIVVGVWGAGDIVFPATGTDVTVNVGRNIDFSQENNSDDRDLIVENGGDGSIEHKLIVNGDIIQSSGNNNTIDFYNGDNKTKVILELQGESNNSYYSTSTSVPQLYRVVLNKGADQSNSFTFSNSFTLDGPKLGVGVLKALELKNGTLILDNSSIDIDLSSGDDDFEIPSTSCLQITQGTANVYGDNTGIWLDGKLLIDGVNGTLDMVSGVGNGNNYIEYSSSGNANIEISDGNLWVGSQIRRGLITEEGILTFNQSGGEVQLGVSDGGDNDRAIFEILNTGSSFTHSNGDFILVNDYRAASIASVYFDPDVSILSSGTAIQFGNAATLTGGKNFTLYAGKSLQNLTINSTSSPKLTLDVVPLTLNEDLTINVDAEFDANGLDLTIKGDMIVDVDGTFTSNQNDTYFSGTVAQQITGSPIFWNLYKTTSNQLSINNDVNVDNELGLNSGAFNDNDNTLSVQGAVNMDITHAWGGLSDGILMNGTTEQVLTGNGTFGKLSINNSSDITVPQGNVFTIDGALQLETGVFDIGKNLLVIDEDAIVIEQNAFSENNMIQTNISFTDAGIIKYFPAINPTDGYSFIYPIGSEGKYSPVELAIDDVDAGGSIRVKAANEKHPTIINDTEPCNEIIDTLNVLNYHWLLEADNIKGFNANANMKYYMEDYQENSAFYDVTDYIAARLLFGSTLWNKYDQASFDEGSTLLRFNFTNADDDAISGDYTAGVEDQAGSCEGAIPDEVPAYISIKDGPWTDATTWDTYPVGGGTVPSNGPRGAIAIVEDIVTIPSNYILNYKTIINATGVLKVGSTFGHRLGIVEGEGTLQLEQGSLPAGIYDDFFGRSGGAIEFTGSDDYDVLSEVNNVRNLKFSGTGERRLPNLDFEVYGLFTIDGDDATLEVINEHDRNMTLDSNIVFNQGKFDAGVDTSTVTFGGTQQQVISGTGSFTGDDNAFNNVIINNSAGVLLNSPIEIDGKLTFTSGFITTDATNILTIDNAAETTAVIGYNSSRYVDGPMRKLVQSNGNFIFPVGDDNRYGMVEVISTSTTSAQYWEAEYYDVNPHGTYNITSLVAPIQSVSNNEYWRIKGPAGGQSHVKIRWDSQSQLPAATDPRSLLRIVEWNGSAWSSVGNTLTDNGINDGRIQTSSKVALDEHVFTIGSEDNTPLPTAGFISNDTTICAGGTATLEIECTGNSYWEVDIYRGGVFLETLTINTSPYNYDVAVAGVYSINAVDGDNGTVPGNPFGNDITVTVITAPNNTYTITPSVPTSYCAGGVGVEVGLDDSDIGVTYQLLLDGNPSGSPVAGNGGAISFGNRTVAGTYTVEAIDNLDLAGSCSEIMTGSLVLTVNALPVFTVSGSSATICDGGEFKLTTTFSTINTPYSIDIKKDGTSVSGYPTAVSISDNPNLYNENLVWTGPLVKNTFSYTVVITDTNGCSDNNIATPVSVDVYKVPETGPQYHLPNTF